MTKAKIGRLIGLVGEEAKADYWGTMQRVAAIGYRGIEGAGELLRGDVTENVKRFHDLGLQVLTTSASRERLRDNLDEIIAEAKALETTRATVWWAPCDTRDAVLSDAALYNEAGSRLADEGIKLCYHHHDHGVPERFQRCAGIGYSRGTHRSELPSSLNWILPGSRSAARTR